VSADIREQVATPNFDRLQRLVEKYTTSSTEAVKRAAEELQIALVEGSP
jgi:hypothetical protein